ncbi:MAG: hypothetical protein BWY83_02157 [bacterium ADurb.Bin478]|nr:MAG: hypothetical protein BWY83_02157 [bacterium ADurb.Bin478]
MRHTAQAAAAQRQTDSGSGDLTGRQREQGRLGRRPTEVDAIEDALRLSMTLRCADEYGEKTDGQPPSDVSGNRHKSSEEK